MNFICERQLRTKDFELFSVINVYQGLDVRIIFNNKDRSSDFSEDKELKKLKELDEDLGSEYMKVHLFTKNLVVYEKFKSELHNLITDLLHHFTGTWWIFVHEVEDTEKASEDYLCRWGFDKNSLIVVNNNIYKNLNQD